MRGCLNLRHEIRAFVFQIMHRAPHQCHRLAHRVVNLREPLSRLLLARNLSHHLGRFGLHDGPGKHMADIVMNLARYACTLRERGHTNRRGAIFLAFRQLRAQPADLVTFGILKPPVLPGERDIARAQQANHESQHYMQCQQYGDECSSHIIRMRACITATDQGRHYGNDPHPSCDDRRDLHRIVLRHVRQLRTQAGMVPSRTGLFDVL